MTIIYDMANGSIQSETTPESGITDTTAITTPAADLRLATIETPIAPSGHNKPQAAVHIIRRLLSSD
jgi:hypothetical protein